MKLTDIKESKRVARKKGQKKGSKKHSDLYTDEDPKGTIKGLGFKDAATAKKGVAKINSVNRTHAHKVQATLVMQQRAKVAKTRAKDPEKKKDLNQAYQIWSKKLAQLKKKTKTMNEAMVQPKRGHNYYQLTKDVPVRYIAYQTNPTGATGVMLHNTPGYIKGKKGAYIIDYYGGHYYVDMKAKFATSIYDLGDQPWKRKPVYKEVDLAPDFASWKNYKKDISYKHESVSEVDYHSKNSRMHKPDWYKLHGDDKLDEAIMKTGRSGNPIPAKATSLKDFVKHIKSLPIGPWDELRYPIEAKVFNPKGYRLKGKPLTSSEKSKFIKAITNITKVNAKKGTPIYSWEIGGGGFKELDSPDAYAGNGMYYVNLRSKSADDFARDMGSGKFGSLD